MKCLFVAAAMFLFLGSVSSQCDSAFFRYTASFIKDMTLLDTNRIIAVGDNGYIIRSDNGGKSWRNINKPLSYVNNAMQLVEDGVGYVVDGLGGILKTEDEGETWFPLLINALGYNGGKSFNDLYFFDKNRGYIVGNESHILSTNDGGKNWKDSIMGLVINLNGITFIDDSIGFICGGSTSLFKTENGGRSWQKISLPFLGSFETFKKVKFINDTTGFVIGSSICIRTTNAGATWTTINSASGTNGSDICFLNEQRGFLTGQTIFQTNDGGVTWNPDLNVPGYSASFYCIATDPAKKKIMIAGGGTSTAEPPGYNGRTIISTTDTGATYISLSLNTQLDYKDVFFLNDSTGYITGYYGYTFRTSDYGETWRPLKNVPALISGNDGREIFFLDSLHGFAATDNIYKTSDGGFSWTKLTTPGTNKTQIFPRQMFFFDTLTGLVQDAGAIYKTINGGGSWTSVSSADLGEGYWDFTVKPNGKAFAVGSGGKAEASIDKGTGWTPFNLNTTESLRSIYFYNNSIGFIGTTDSIIYKTINGGDSWTEINTGTHELPIISFHFVNDSIGYFIGSTGTGINRIYKTKNGGLTWTLEMQPSRNVSRFNGFKTFYIVGEQGFIMKSDKRQKPTIPGYIYAPEKGCLDSRTGFITGLINGVNYNWTLASGGTNISNTYRDTVLWNSLGFHTLSVSVSNVCGVSPSRSVTTEVILFQPVITAQDSVLTVTEGATYQWYLNGMTISAAQGGNTRSIKGKASGSYTVRVTNKYGCTQLTLAFIYAVPLLVCPGGNASIMSNVLGNTYKWRRDDGSGFVSISDNSFYTGTNTYLLQLTGIPSSWYGYKFMCSTDFGPSYTFSIQFANKWTGAASTAWENTANWSCGTLPDENTDVVINSGTVVINSNVTIRRLSLNSTVNLTVQPGKTLTITH